jgi:peroxiredoxin
MAETPSKMVPLGMPAPDFRLPDSVTGKFMSLAELKSGIATVIMFICNHCPYVKHINDGMVELTNEYIKKGISFIAINANDTVNYHEDSFEKMKLYAERLGYNFPYLLDETQEVAKAYDAACTPDIYVYDKNLKLVYRGQFDDSRPGNGKPVTGRDLRKALDYIIEEKHLDFPQIPSVGCNIKWKR